MTDQREVEHTYGYDDAGRMETDSVTDLGDSGIVDGAVLRIERGYDDMGRLKTLTSYNAATSGTIVNQDKWTYDGYGNIAETQQAHAGAVDGGSLAVVYTYDDGASGGVAQYVRLTEVTYPDGSHVFYNYPTSGIGAALNRLDNIAADSSGTTQYLHLDYLGAGTIVTETHPSVSGGLTLSYDPAHNNTFSGWDPFGRVIDQLWTDGAGTTTLDEYQYTYDYNSNRLTRNNTLNSALDEAYRYDGLNRLSNTQRDSAAFQSWNLDSLGNWSSFTNGANTDLRTVNAANEITAITGASGTVTPVTNA